MAYAAYTAHFITDLMIVGPVDEAVIGITETVHAVLKPAFLEKVDEATVGILESVHGVIVLVQVMDETIGITEQLRRFGPHNAQSDTVGILETVHGVPKTIVNQGSSGFGQYYRRRWR